MAASALDATAGLERLPGDAASAASALLGQLGALGEQLPPATLDWRLNVSRPAPPCCDAAPTPWSRHWCLTRVCGAQVMRKGIKALEPQLRKVEQRVLVVVGEEDRLMPAVEEAARLKTRMQRVVTRVLPGSGHNLMQERGVDLFQLMQVRHEAAPPLALGVIRATKNY